MKTIGIDLDDVLLNFNDSFLDFHNEVYGTAYERKDITQFDVEDLFGLTVEELKARLAKFYETDYHKNALPIEGAVWAIGELAQKHKLIIITSSPETAKEQILLWLDKHFGNAFQDIHFTKKHMFDERRNKGEMCQEPGIEVFIDEALHNAEDIAAVGIPVYLPDVPWNQGETGPLVKRVYSWKEIVDELS